MLYNNIIAAIGNTPVVKVDDVPYYYAKLEGLNPFGSIKDRAAAYAIRCGYEQQLIHERTRIVESSSGNFAIALAAVCQLYGNPFTCVVDPHLTPLNREILESFDANIVVAETADNNGSYLTNRLEIVAQMVTELPDLFWVNQYDSANIRRAYYETIGSELITDFEKNDYLFMPISTCGSIAGLSTKLKEYYHDIQIIAVDIEGSKIFDQNTYHKRSIPGMGASIIPGNLPYARIDEYIQCRQLNAKRVYAYRKTSFFLECGVRTDDRVSPQPGA